MNIKSSGWIPFECLAWCAKCEFPRRHHLAGGPDDGGYQCLVCQEFLGDDAEISCPTCDGDHESHKTWMLCKPLAAKVQDDIPQSVGYRDYPHSLVIKDLMARVVRLTELNGQLVAQLEKGPVPVVDPHLEKKKDLLDLVVLIGLVITIVVLGTLGYIHDR